MNQKISQHWDHKKCFGQNNIQEKLYILCKKLITYLEGHLFFFSLKVKFPEMGPFYQTTRLVIAQKAQYLKSFLHIEKWFNSFKISYRMVIFIDF